MKSNGREEGSPDSPCPFRDGRGAAGVRPSCPDDARASERIVILGGGITGLTAAWELSKHPGSRVLLIEKDADTGGLAGSFKRRDLVFDFGSHRIHEQYDPEVFGIIKDLLGDELLERPRRGRIRIRSKFLDYPPSVIQILTSFGYAGGARYLWDFLSSRNCFPSARRGATRHGPASSFEEYATRAVGKSLYESIYKPYASKLWGVAPAGLSFEPAVSRVRKFEARAVWKEVRKKITGAHTAPSFYYPAKGFGQIAEKIRERFIENGGEILCGCGVEALELKNDSEIEAVVVRAAGGVARRIPARLFISTVPIDVLHRLLCAASGGRDWGELGLSWRSLRILYLLTPDKIPSEHETYYFPEPDVLFGRVSEPAKYSPHLNPAGGKTALAVEIPCTFGDEVWSMNDEAVAARCVGELRDLNLLSAEPRGETEYFSRRIKNLYPVYALGWREKLDEALRGFNSIKNLYLVGRPALFLHCNVDHCMAMALRLARFLSAEGRAREEWERSLGDVFSLSLHD